MAKIEDENEVEQEQILDETVDTVTEEDVEEAETDETEEDEKVLTGNRQCKGLFAMYPVSDFTQDENYSDTYLKQRGLFKGDVEEAAPEGE